jgi:hypothetical protein
MVSRAKKDAERLVVYLRVGAGTGEQPHEALANLGDAPADIEHFIQRWRTPLLPGMEAQMSRTTMTDLDDGRLEAHIEHLPPKELAETLGARYLAARDSLRAAWRDKARSGFQWIFDADAADRPPIIGRLSTLLTVGGKGRVEAEPEYLWQAISLLFLRDRAAKKTAICANKDCPNPFFIRKRKTQKYCEAGPCVERAQREQKRLWWARNRGRGARQ